jgi:predicted cupin superfamily sugar epimerase
MEAVIHPRAQELIDRLGLERHPEGGHFAQIFRSADSVSPSDGRAQRRAMTTIYFLLTAGEHSRWHRVVSDEAWHFYEGAPLELRELTPDLGALRMHRLGPYDDTHAPVHVVPAGYWQAARSTGGYTLVGCTVGPGFEFDDFTMLSDLDEISADVRRRHPEAAAWI